MTGRTASEIMQNIKTVSAMDAGADAVNRVFYAHYGRSAHPKFCADVVTALVGVLLPPRVLETLKKTATEDAMEIRRFLDANDKPLTGGD